MILLPRTQFSFSSFLDFTLRNLSSFNICPTFFLTFIVLWPSSYMAGWDVPPMPSRSTPGFPLLRQYCNCPITGQTMSLDYSFLGTGTPSYNFLKSYSLPCVWHLAKAQCLLNECDKWLQLRRSQGTRCLKNRAFNLFILRGGNKELGKSLSNQKRTLGEKKIKPVP